MNPDSTANSCPVTIRLFGGLSVQHGGGPTAAVTPGQTGSLLAYLALNLGRRIPRLELAELLWPESEPENAYQNLRQCLHSLRRVLEPPPIAAGSVLLANRADVLLNPEVVRADVGEFQYTLGEAKRAPDSQTRIERLVRAADLYAGQLLPGFYLDHFVSEQRRLAEEHLQALHDLVRELESLGDLRGAVPYARRAALLDPTSEPACGALMRLRAGLGEPAEVLREYQEYEARCRKELDEPPPPSAREMADRWCRLARERADQSRVGLLALTAVAPTRRAPESAPPADCEDRPGRPMPLRGYRGRRIAVLTLGAALGIGAFVLAAWPGIVRSEPPGPPGVARDPRGTATIPAQSAQVTPAATQTPPSAIPESRPVPFPHRTYAHVSAAAPPLKSVRNPRLVPHVTAAAAAARSTKLGRTRDFRDALWIAPYVPHPGDTGSEPTAMTVDSDGNVYITGFVETSKTDADYLTLKYSPDGTKLWEKRYDGPNHDVDRPWAIVVDASGNVYVTGESDSGSGYPGDRLGGLDIATIKYAPDGTELWVRRYAGPGGGRDAGYAIAVDKAGNVYVAGRSWGGDPAAGGTGMDMVLLKYSPTGKLHPPARFPTGITDYQARLATAFDPDGSTYVSVAVRANSQAANQPESYNIMTLKYNADCQLVWDKPYSLPGSLTQWPTCATLDHAGDLVVAGGVKLPRKGDAPRDDFLVVKYAPDGTLRSRATQSLWNCPYDTWGVAVSPTNSVYIVGRISVGGTSESRTVMLHADGEFVWTSASVPGGGTAICVDSAGTLYSCGTASFSVSNDASPPDLAEPEYATAQYDPGNGHINRLLRLRGVGPLRAGPKCIAVDPDDNVVVTGQAYNGHGYGIVTVKYPRALGSSH